jgi:hypothetical protein
MILDEEVLETRCKRLAARVQELEGRIELACTVHTCWPLPASEPTMVAVRAVLRGEPLPKLCTLVEDKVRVQLEVEKT